MGSAPAHFLACSEFSTLCAAPTKAFNLRSLIHPFKQLHLGSLQRSRPFLGFSRCITIPPTIHVRASKGGDSKKSTKSSGKAVTRKKESPWNDANTEHKISRKKSSGRRPPSSSSSKQRKAEDTLTRVSELSRPDGPRVLVSAVMPVETEKVLQTQEPSITPSWQTFISSLSGVWRGVGAAFSPITAEMEAIALGDKNEMLYDCRVLSTIEEVQGTSKSRIHRKTIWAVGNPLGEHARAKYKVQQMLSDEDTDEEDEIHDNMEDHSLENDWGLEISDDILLEEEVDTGVQPQDSSDKRITADLESKDMTYDTVMEEDVLELEPGLVYFEDGSYSRGPIELLTGDTSEFASPTYKIEQCLVRGGHSRLRLVHTIAVEEKGEEIQLLRVVVYEEEWMGPSNMKSISDSGGHHLKLFSQCPRLPPQELVGTWKVFEMSAIAVLPDNLEAGRSTERPPYVYMSMEMQKRRLLPDIPLHFADEDILDMQDVTVMWLPGGVNAYVDIKEGRTLTIGVGWYSDGVNLVMERDYSANGKLFEVHTKSEVKGGWVGGRM